MLLPEKLLMVASASGDLNFNDVSLLLHGDGTDGSTTFIDSSSYNASPVVSGNTRISTAAKKFGTGSMFFDGTNDVLTYSAAAQYRLDADFTIEAWVYPPTRVQYYPTVINIGDEFPAPSNLAIYFNHFDNANEYLIYVNSTTLLTGTIAPGLNSWHHFALTRSGNTWRLFVNGNLDVSTTRSGTVYSANPPLIVGGESATRTFTSFNGYIDDLRVIKGVARYTANFTPPTEPFPDN